MPWARILNPHLPASLPPTAIGLCLCLCHRPLARTFHKPHQQFPCARLQYHPVLHAAPILCCQNNIPPLVNLCISPVRQIRLHQHSLLAREYPCRPTGITHSTWPGVVCGQTPQRLRLRIPVLSLFRPAQAVAMNYGPGATLRTGPASLWNIPCLCTTAAHAARSTALLRRGPCGCAKARTHRAHRAWPFPYQPACAASCVAGRSPLHPARPPPPLAPLPARV